MKLLILATNQLPQITASAVRDYVVRTESYIAKKESHITTFIAGIRRH